MGTKIVPSYATLEEAINKDLPNVDKWCEENGMKWKTSKYQAMVMEKSHVRLKFHCENVIVLITKDFETLGVTVDDNKMKFENRST